MYFQLFVKIGDGAFQPGQKIENLSELTCEQLTRTATKAFDDEANLAQYSANLSKETITVELRDMPADLPLFTHTVFPMEQSGESVHEISE